MPRTSRRTSVFTESLIREMTRVAVALPEVRDTGFVLKALRRDGVEVAQAFQAAVVGVAVIGFCEIPHKGL